MSLTKLCVSENQDFDEEVSIVEVLLDTLACDPSMYVLYPHSVIPFPSHFSSDVRRTALLVIPVNTQTLPCVLERTVDSDITIRKLLYSVVLDKLTTVEGEDGKKTFGPTHPRNLSPVQREAIIRNGLGDRDRQVRASAALLLETWVDFIDVKAEDKDVKVEGQVQEKMQTSVLSLLTLFNLRDGTVAEDALLSIFKTRVDIFDTINFGGKNPYFHVVLCLSASSISAEDYWTTLTPERAFLARVFVEHCKNVKDNAKLENLPVVTEIAFRIQEAYNHLLDDIANQEDTAEDLGSDENERKEARELVISELLKLAVNLDYSDEIGRRKTFQLVRESSLLLHWILSSLMSQAKC
jgi:condensin complex subunit 3